MRFFGRALPFLFVSPSSRLYNENTIQPLKSTVDEIFEVSAPRKIVQDVQEIYKGLEEGCFTKHHSPTIDFKYTSPSHERLAFRESMMSSSMEESVVFEKIEASHEKKKPILLYLPGLDGVGISGTRQFDDLSNTFEFWRMMIDRSSDRSSFTELTTAVSSFIQEVAIENNRDVILVGESFGGLLAPSVALRVQSMTKRKAIKSPIKGMVLVNPATSFDKTQWSTLAPILASLRHIEREEEEGTSLKLPTPYSVVGGIALALTVPDRDQYQNIFNIFSSTKVSTADELQDVIGSMRDGFGMLADNLPATVIEHRVGQWLPVGVEVVNKRLKDLDTPTLVIAGEDDNMLPTKEEGERLVKVMKDCTSMFVKGAGHFVLDDRFNLTEAIIDASFDPLGKNVDAKKYDPILDWELPTGDALREAIDNRVRPLRLATSPKFFSTGSDGKRRIGLGQVPNNTNGPILFVANHQLLGLDLGLIIAELIEERGIAARGLAHPFVFQGGGNGFGGGAGPTGTSRRVTKKNKEGIVDRPEGDFQTFGAVMVTPKNYYRLMQTGQCGLLFPGGVREVFHGKDEAYELFWPEKVDFVRVAARFNATIIPISAVGAADSASILLDNTEILDLPFGLGERALSNTQNTISARFDQENGDELFQPPLVVPKLTPARHYFIFGKPFDTSAIDHQNKEACGIMYKDIKAELRRGLDDLLDARKKDPYQDFSARFITEQITGKQTPTFPIEELNK